MPPIWLLTLVLKTGIPSRFAKIAAWLAVALAVAGAIALAITAFHSWVGNQREEAVTLDRADISAEVSNRIIEADRAANANATAAAVIERQNEKELDDAIAEPNANSTRVVSVLERLREQQAKGRR